MPKPTTGRTTPSKRPKRPTPRPARGHRDIKPEKAKTVGEGAPRPPQEPRKTPRARNPITDEEIALASTWEERGLVCSRVLAEGGWDAQVPRLLKIWNCTEPALGNYRRAGKVALAALTSDDSAKRLDALLAALWTEADECEAMAKDYAAHGRPALASRYREMRRKALESFAELAGLVQRKISVSLEADPRFQGMYQAIGAALEDFDRLRVAWLDEVAKLTGGPLPAIPLPSAREHVKAAVKRYEVEVGARAEAKRLAA